MIYSYIRVSKVGAFGLDITFRYKLTEAFTAAGGNSTIVRLPKEGIYGNDHFMFQDLNNDVIADHVEAWIQENVG